MSTNQQEAEATKSGFDKAKNNENPWVRVIDNCDFTTYAGGKDVSRMKQAMVERKADITKRGGLKKVL